MQPIPLSLRRVGIAAAAVVVLGGAAVGIASAQQATPTPQSGAYQKFVDALAQKLGVSSQTLQDDITQARQAAGMPANGGFPGRGGPRGGAGFGANLQVAATAIGITPQELRTALPGSSLAQIAQAHGKTADQVATALKDDANKRIDAAVSAGRLTADQGNTRKTTVDQRIDQMVNQVMPKGGVGTRGGPGGPGMGPGMIGQGLAAAANVIGITPQELRTALPGSSLAQIAQAHGKTADQVATALKDDANKRIDAAVSAGRLTADQGNTMKTNIDQHIDQFVNQVVPQGGFGRRGAPGTQPAPAQSGA
jgi:polyhydroxyalkanoate synthesis regulator phasin